MEIDDKETNWKSGFGFGFSRLRQTGPVVENPCREVVEVPGGIDWRLRKLCDSFPQYAWTMPCATSTIQYHFEIAKNENLVGSVRTQKSGDSPILPIFYATIPHFASPFELSIQPKYLEKVRTRIMKELEETYGDGRAEQYVFEEDQIFIDVPCACNLAGVWYRGIVKDLSSKTSALVYMLDIAGDKFVNLTEIRPLLSRFRRVPPLSLRCRVKDVFVNDLDTSKVELFRQMVKDCGYLVRVELCNVEEPYHINIYHPTVSSMNIGALFHRKAEDEAREAAKVQRWKAHVRRMNNDNDSDFSDEEDEEVEEKCERQFIKFFERTDKLPKSGGSALYVRHVENATMIFVKTEFMWNKTEEIEARLKEVWSDLPPIPSNWLLTDAACGVQIHDSYYRASIQSVDDSSNIISVFLIDHGLFEIVERTQLRALPEEELLFSEKAMSSVVSLNRDILYFPHPSETIFLKELLPEDTIVYFTQEGGRRVPARGTLMYEDGTDVNDLLLERLEKERVDVLCRQLLRYNPSSNTPDVTFVHRLHCPTGYIKGRLTLSPSGG